MQFLDYCLRWRTTGSFDDIGLNDDFGYMSKLQAQALLPVPAAVTQEERDAHTTDKPH